MRRILAIPGDGIGPEVIAAAVAVLHASGVPLAIEEAEAGWGTFQRGGESLPTATIAAARVADALLFGAVASPSAPVPGYRSPIVRLRRELDLFANIRPVHGVRADLVVVRENTEGLYAGRERLEDGGAMAIAERVITRSASERITRVAFELARQRAHPNGPRVAIVHKANVLRETCGLFRAAAFDIAADYPDVAADELLVDTAALRLVQRPEAFDVIVTTNLFGDILSDVACHWGGGLGMALSANLGERYALFEPVHGAAPDIAGQGIANPLAAIGCSAWMLAHLAERTCDTAERALLARAAERIRAAVAHVVATGPHPRDLGGIATTADVTTAVVAKIKD